VKNGQLREAGVQEIQSRVARYINPAEIDAAYRKVKGTDRGNIIGFDRFYGEVLKGLGKPGVEYLNQDGEGAAQFEHLRLAFDNYTLKRLQDPQVRVNSKNSIRADGVTIVLGPAGSGKSALVDELIESPAFRRDIILDGPDHDSLQKYVETARKNGLNVRVIVALDRDLGGIKGALETAAREGKPTQSSYDLAKTYDVYRSVAENLNGFLKGADVWAFSIDTGSVFKSRDARGAIGRLAKKVVRVADVAAARASEGAAQGEGAAGGESVSAGDLPRSLGKENLEGLNIGVDDPVYAGVHDGRLIVSDPRLTPRVMEEAGFKPLGDGFSWWKAANGENKAVAAGGVGANTTEKAAKSTSTDNAIEAELQDAADAANEPELSKGGGDAGGAAKLVSLNSRLKALLSEAASKGDDAALKALQSLGELPVSEGGTPAYAEPEGGGGAKANAKVDTNLPLSQRKRPTGSTEARTQTAATIGETEAKNIAAAISKPSGSSGEPSAPLAKRARTRGNAKGEQGEQAAGDLANAEPASANGDSPIGGDGPSEETIREFSGALGVPPVKFKDIYKTIKDAIYNLRVYLATHPEKSAEELRQSVEALDRLGVSFNEFLDKCSITPKTFADKVMVWLFAHTHGVGSRDANGRPLVVPDFGEPTPPPAVRDLTKAEVALLNVASPSTILGGVFKEYNPSIDYTVQFLRKGAIVHNYVKYFSDVLSGVTNQSAMIKLIMAPEFFKYLKLDRRLGEIRYELSRYGEEYSQFKKARNALLKALDHNASVDDPRKLIPRDEINELYSQFNDAAEALGESKLKYIKALEEEAVQVNKQIKDVAAARRDKLIECAKRFSDARIYFLAEKGLAYLDDALKSSGDLILAFEDSRGKVVEVPVSRDEVRVAREIASAMLSMKAELDARGIPTINLETNKGYMHRNIRGLVGDFVYDYEVSRRNPGQIITEQDIKFHSREGNLVWNPSAYASLSAYAPTFADKIVKREWVSKWQRWVQDNYSTTPNTAAAVQGLINRYSGLTPEPSTPLGIAADYLIRAFYTKHIGMMLSVADKHLAKVLLTPSQSGVVATINAIPDQAMAAIGNLLEAVEGTKLGEYLNISKEQDSFANRARLKAQVANFVRGGKHLDVIVERQLGSEVNSLSSVSARVWRWLARNPTAMVEAFDRGVNFYATIAAAQQEVGSAGAANITTDDIRKAIYKAAANQLAACFMPYDRGAWSDKRLWRAVVQFDQTPTHLTEYFINNAKTLTLQAFNVARGRIEDAKEPGLSAVRYFITLGLLKYYIDDKLDTSFHEWLAEVPPYMKSAWNIVKYAMGYGPKPYQDNMFASYPNPMFQEALKDILSLGPVGALKTLTPDALAKLFKYRSGHVDPALYGPQGSTEQALRYFSSMPRHSIKERREAIRTMRDQLQRRHAGERYLEESGINHLVDTMPRAD